MDVVLSREMYDILLHSNSKLILLTYISSRYQLGEKYNG